MAIESNIVAAGPTVPRAKTPVHVETVRLNETFSPGIQLIWDPQLQDWTSQSLGAFPVHGQLVAVMDLFNNEVAMYVGYSATPSVANTSSWKRVRVVSSFVNPDTGKTWDPLQNF